MIEKRFYEELYKNLKANPDRLITNIYEDISRPISNQWDSIPISLEQMMLSYIKNGDVAKVEDLFRKAFAEAVSARGELSNLPQTSILALQKASAATLRLQL